jgi:hypothetical protein
MIKLYFEETVGQCQNEALYTNGTRCKSVGLLRRVMGSEYSVIGVSYCRQCMPEFFENRKNYIVVKALKAKIKDPVFEDYINFYKQHFTVVARKEKGYIQ